MYKIITTIIICTILTGCFLANSPPFYERDAKSYLTSKGEDSKIIQKLVEYKPLTKNEAEILFKYDDINVLHLLGSNQGTPIYILKKLADHGNFEVRTGVASNKNTPLPLLLKLRTINRYTTVNLVLSENPAIPQEILREMYHNNETSLWGLATNPNCPEEIMILAAKSNNWMDRSCIGSNHNIPIELFDILKNDTDSLNLLHLASNPKIPRSIFNEIKEKLKTDKNEGIRRDMMNMKYPGDEVTK